MMRLSRSAGELSLLLCLASGVLWAQAPGAASAALPPVVIADVVAQQVVPRQTFVGVVKPARRSVIGTAVDGRVEKMLVDVGDWVQMPPDGRPAELALLRTVTINIEIAAAEAELEFRKHELAEAKTSRPEEIANASARMKAAEAIMHFSQEKADRDQKLFEQGRLVSAEEYRRSQSTALEASRLYEAAKANYEMMAEGPRIEKRNQMEARVKIQEQEIARLRDREEKFTIKAPFSGYVVAKHTEVGAWVKSGDPIIEMVELDPAEVAVSVPEASIVGVQPGMSALVSLSALPETNRPGGALAGTVVGVLPDADPRTRTYTVRVHVRNPRRQPAAGVPAPKANDPRLVLKAGMLARVDLQIDDPVADARLIPKDAIIVNGPLRQIMLFRPQAGQTDVGTIEPVSVELGVTQGVTVQIASPEIKPGEWVVVEGNERLRKGMVVRAATRKSTQALLAPTAP